jgi:DNA-binding NtrC family response regulator
MLPVGARGVPERVTKFRTCRVMAQVLKKGTMNACLERLPAGRRWGIVRILMKKSPALGVLVVDDEALMRWSLAETLKAQGHSVVEAADARGAITALEQPPVAIDVVMLDHRLPDTMGLDLLVAIRRLSPRSKVVLMTSYGTPEITREALRRGAVGVIHKPLEMNAVGDLIARIHESASL